MKELDGDPRGRRLDALTHAAPPEVAPEPDNPAPAVLDIVDEWGHGSFPASDPPANW